MTRERTAARRSAGKLAIAVFLLGSLLIGLSACRGFFGQGPIALMEIDSGGDTELPVLVEFDISGSRDPDGVIASFTLDFGDGSEPETGDNVSALISHPYLVADTYTVELTVTDTDGRIGMTNGVVVVGPAMITFAANRGFSFDIYRMEADGTNQAAVFHTADDELFPDLVRGARDRIAYAAEDGFRWNIWTMTATGGSRTPLTTQTLSSQIQPSWSHDALTLAYASNAVEPLLTTAWEIYTVTAAGTGAMKLTSQTPSWAIAPSFSPVPGSGDILFVSGSQDDTGTAADGGSAIWLWDASEDEAVLLKDGPGRDGDASPATAGLLLPLGLPTGAGISRPVWSPDGTKIAYAAEVDAGDQIDIFVMDDLEDESSARTLEAYVDDLGVLNTAITTNDDEFCPYWLDDGTDEGAIVYAKDDGSGNIRLYKVALATGVITDLLTESGDNVSPASKR
jgi:PKD repeat protein